MPRYGGTAPYPRRYGGGTPILVSILDSLNAARGTAYDVTPTSNVYVENMAHARAITAAWGTNQRLANQFDPTRTTSMLARWERIMGIAVDPNATAIERRKAIVNRWKRSGVAPTIQEITDGITASIGNIFVALTHETVVTALAFWPGGTPNPLAPWYSTIARIVIEVTQPADMSDGEFYARKGQLTEMLDARLPAWMTWSVWRKDAHTGTKGFFLDAKRNMDNDAFAH